MLLQETHCTDAEKLVLPNYQLAGSSLSRKHGLVTFVQCPRATEIHAFGPISIDIGDRVACDLPVIKLFHAECLTMARRHLKGIHSRSDTNKTGARGLSFYYPRLLYCLNQMLAVMLLSQHRVSSSKTVRPRAPCGARCIGHAVSTWSAVCSEVPYSQFGEGVRPHLCMDQ